ncbi:MAG TPA: hypothetical protein VFG04_24180 [Planctomycetaceae bacterium]|jgi:hypothetical protein|nr:hypothetical protein [Planctomycetaceae bacterium]
MSRISCCLVVVSLTLYSPIVLAGKPTLTIALDDGPHSRMLKSELTRDWTQPNPVLRLTRAQKHDLRTRGTQLNALAAKIDSHFHIVYVTAGIETTVPLSIRFHLPAVRINRGRWETLDPRAFAFEGRPLVTLDWYRSRHAAIARDVPRPTAADYWSYCSEEGWSGREVVETPAPWERANPFPSYE